MAEVIDRGDVAGVATAALASATTTVVRGTRVLLRPMTAADIGATHVGWLNDPIVVRYSNQRFRRHSIASCLAYLRSFEGTANGYWSIRRLEDDLPLGTLTAYRAPQHGTADVGILLGERQVWGQGYGQEAWNLVLDALAREPGLRKLTCGTLANNGAMRRLAERAGMHVEGVRRAQEVVDGLPEDIVLYARFVKDRA